MNYELLSYLLKAGLVLAILTSAYAWLVKRETFLQVNRWLLWINVAATLLLPIIPLPDVEWMPDAPAKAVAVVLPPKKSTSATIPGKSEATVSTPQPMPAPTSVLTETKPKSPLSVWDWIGIVYGAVAGLLTLKLLIQLGTLWRLKRNGTQYATDEGVFLIESDAITSPFSFFNRIFYNPAQHNDEEWAQVWSHECVHAHQLHSIDMLTAEVLKIVFWFNPFAWWHQRLVQETLEFITDRAVLDSGVEKKSYQYHLLRTTLSADKQTFTNNINAPHFNKSFLKERIEMMNKSNSKWMGIGKYFAFVGMLWLCAAFTKPYREEVAAKMVEKVPELKEVLLPEPAKKAVFNDFVWEEPLKETRKDSLHFDIKAPVIVDADTQTLVSSTKYVVYTPNKLHLLITPKTTFEDLVKIRHELDRHGLSLEVLAWQLDSLGRYVRKAEVIVRGYSSTPKLITRGSDLLNKPINPIAVILQLKQMKFRQENVTMNIFGETPAEKSLKDLAFLDKEFANFDVRWSQSVYEIYLKNRQRGFYNVPITVFPAKSLFKEDNFRFQRPFAIVTNDLQKEVLKVNSSLKNAKFRLNDNPAFLADIEDIPPDKFIKAVKYEVYDDKKTVSEIYMLVYTKQ